MIDNEEIILKKVKAYAVESIPALIGTEAYKNLAINIAKHWNCDNILIQLSTYLFAEELETISEKIKYPLNWFEAFKERWFPNFLLKKFPIKYFERYIILEAKAWYPKLSAIKGGGAVIKIHNSSFNADSSS